MAAALPAVVTAGPKPVPVADKTNWSAAAIRPPVPKAFCSDSVGNLVLVKVQAMFAPTAVAAASSVRVLPDKVAVPVGPMPVQVALARA